MDDYSSHILVIAKGGSAFLGVAPWLDDQMFRVTFDYIINLEPAWDTLSQIWIKKKEEEEEEKKPLTQYQAKELQIPRSTLGWTVCSHVVTVRSQQATRTTLLDKHQELYQWVPTSQTQDDKAGVTKQDKDNDRFAESVPEHQFKDPRGTSANSQM